MLNQKVGQRLLISRPLGGGGLEKTVSAEQSAIPFFAQLGFTCNNDDISKRNAYFSLSTSGYSRKYNGQNEDNEDAYLSTKISAHIMDWSESADTYWYARGGLCILNELVGSQGVFMETVTKDITSGKTNYNIVQFNPESTSIPGYTAYYARQSQPGTGPNYSTYQYVRFSIGDPNNQGDYHYIIEYDFT